MGRNSEIYEGFTLDELRARLGSVKEEENLIQDFIDQKLKKTLVQCTDNNHGKGCGMALKVGELTYIQTHWYESPHGCTGGDIWHQGEGQFFCPHCNHRNRLYDRPEIEKLKHLFKDSVDEHSKR